jgi:hypothetical protein
MLEALAELEQLTLEQLPLEVVLYKSQVHLDMDHLTNPVMTPQEVMSAYLVHGEQWAKVKLRILDAVIMFTDIICG